MDKVLQEIYKSALIMNSHRYIVGCINSGNNEYTVVLEDYQMDAHGADIWESRIVLDEFGVTPSWNIKRRQA